VKINCILTYNPRTFQVKNVKIVKFFFSETTFPVLPCPTGPECRPDGTPGPVLAGVAPQFFPFCVQIERKKTQSETKNRLLGPKTHSPRFGKGDDSLASVNLGMWGVWDNLGRDTPEYAKRVGVAC
jgi:hypothetical protein